MSTDQTGIALEHAHETPDGFAPAPRAPDDVTTRAAPGKPGPRRTLLLIDPKPLTRDFVARWIRSKVRDVEIIGLAGTADLDRARLGSWCGLSLLYVGAAPIDEPWVEAEMNRLAELLPDAPIILMGDAEDGTTVRGALELGARGYIPTSFSVPVSTAALNLILAGGSYFPPLHAPAPAAAVARPSAAVPNLGVVQGRPEPGLPLDLTSRERDVLRLIGRGLANKLIANELSISESTVKAHVHHIIRKLRATNRTEAALIAVRLLSEPSGSEQTG